MTTRADPTVNSRDAWGKVLWEEPNRSKKNIIIDIFMISIGIFLLLFSVYIYFDDGFNLYSIGMLIPAFILLFGAAVSLRFIRSYYPRRVYEKGLTFPSGSFLMMNPEEECFYYYNQIKSIRIENGSKEFDFPYKIIYFDIEEKDKIIKQRLFVTDKIGEMDSNAMIVDIIMDQEPSIKIDGYNLLHNESQDIGLINDKNR